MLTLLSLLLALGGVEPSSSALLEAPVLSSEKPPELGHGYRKNLASIEVMVSRAFGTKATGSNFSHDLWLAQIQGGFMLAEVMEPHYWFGGNVEMIGKLLLGGQDNPEGAYFCGVNGGLRYHFRTGTAFAPFLGGSIGVAVTDIGTPDATGKFQFNEQIGVGTRYLLSQHHALTIEYDYWHVSNGDIREPNDGVNAHVVSLGFAWLF
jgi:hypothetical protein